MSILIVLLGTPFNTHMLDFVIQVVLHKVLLCEMSFFKPINVKSSLVNA